MQEVTYLDHNATAPLHPVAKDAMFAVMGAPLNPSSIHASGRAARKLVEEARAKILASVNAKALVFCGSATEANNFALSQVTRDEKRETRVITSAIEHESVWNFRDAEIKVLPSGIIDLDDLEKVLSNLASRFSVLVSVMLANNETGIIQPIKEVVAIAKKFDALVHCDAVQAYGRIPIDFADLGVDFMTIAAHKIGGPVGTAALVHKENIELKPFLRGGGQEKNKRAGTENVAAIAGFAAISDLGFMNSDLRDYLEEKIRNQKSEIIGFNLPRLPNTSCIIHPKMEAATQLIAFDMAGICVSSGSACSSGKVDVSRTLKAMGVDNAKNAIRVSTGWNTSKADIDRFLQILKDLG